jgi:hypothetical protein
MYYLKWTERDIENLSASTGLKVLLTEVDSGGRVVREIGFNERQKLVHKSPTQSNPYGLFDNQVIAIANLCNDLTKEDFESLWIIYGHSPPKLRI